MRSKLLAWNAFLLVILFPWLAGAQDFKKWEVKIDEYKQWLELVRLDGHHFWTRLDSTRRPHRLYVGEGFHKAEHHLKEQFVEIFSHYLAGHPEKYMLIDIFDAISGSPVGEFGWGGFRLYSSSQ
jgi:hypothetical protein